MRLRWIALAGGALLLAIAGGAVSPSAVETRNTREPLLDGAVIDPANRDRIERACANCHSEQVRWPWYSHVAPVSWLLEHDVKTAREHMNLSQWSAYSDEERIALLATIGAVLKNKQMPPKRYTALHAESALSDSERSTLYAWAKSERRRLRTLTNH